MGRFFDLMNPFVSPPDNNNKLCLHIDDTLILTKLSTHLDMLLSQVGKTEEPIIVCIGTDRSTGDSLGPFTGWWLNSFIKTSRFKLYGTIDNPIHANNLSDCLTTIKALDSSGPIIAIDACLGQVSSVGTIIIDQSPLKPGSGLHKNLPKIGDISINGVVNVGGYLEYQILQNTRLSIVLKMSRTIARSILLSLHKRKYNDFKVNCH